MSRNVKRFLAVSLLSLTPSLALAGQHEFGDLDFLSKRDEYVSIRQESVQLPVRSQDGAAVGPAYQTFYIANWTGLNTYPGYSLTGSLLVAPPNPLPPVAPNGISGYFQLYAPTPPVTQTYYYTTNPADPTGAAKTCRWQLVVNNSNGLCTAQLHQAAFGTQGVLCAIDTAQSFVDQNTCQAQIVTIIQ